MVVEHSRSAARCLALVLALLASVACPRREGGGEHPPGEPDTRAQVDSAAEVSADASEPLESFEPFAPARECESLCGLVHDCLLAESPPPGFPELAPRQAASLELECLAHCIAGDGSLVGSRFAGCGTSLTCAGLLPCVRASWPTQAEPGEPELTPSPSGSGCREGCKRLGECFDAGAPLIDDCTQGCEDKLGDADEIAFGECTRSSDCLLMLECMQKFPGA